MSKPLSPAEMKVTKAIIKFTLDYPFFATLALNMRYVPDSGVPFAVTNGSVTRYNPTYIEMLSPDQVLGLLAQSVMHPALLHHTRLGAREKEKWNMACILAVNLLLKPDFKLPPDSPVHDDFKDMAAEEVYNKIESPKGNGGGSGDGQGQQVPGCSIEQAQAATRSELDSIERDAKDLLVSAVMIAKQRGNLPAHLERLVEDMLQPKIHWKDVLQQFFSKADHSDYTWTKPNKRYLSYGIYLPSMNSTHEADVVMMVDTSGSIGGDILNQFAAEIRDIAATLNAPFKIIWVDAAVAGVQDIEQDEELELKPCGGGGTSFIPGFEWLEEQGIVPSAVVYLTDGFCDSYPDTPEFPVLWAVIDNKGFKPPFGEVLYIED